MSSKILEHPKKDEIIKKLMNGESVKTVESWLRKTYTRPKDKKYRISYMTLQSFRKDYLQLDGESLDRLKTIQKEREGEIKEIEELEKRNAVISSNAYQDKLNSIVNDKIDVTRKLIEMEALISARLEYYFNSMQNNPNMEIDKTFISYIKVQQKIMEDWKRMVEGMVDHRIEHNLNVNIVNEQVNVLKGVVYEILKELDPQLVPIFIDKINERLNPLSYNSDDYHMYANTQGILDAKY